MKLSVEGRLGNELDTSAYSSAAQIARIRTENWVEKYGFCPNCGNNLIKSVNNREACDFSCGGCLEEFELKSKKGKIGKKLVNGAYATLVRRVNCATNPNLYVLQYNAEDFFVENFFVVPRYFFTETIIERRRPLAVNARRAGWVGCNILVGSIPETGKIYYVKNRLAVERQIITENWSITRFLEKQSSLTGRKWLLDIMMCIEKLESATFSLNEIYKFEDKLKLAYPNNMHIREKIRQKLQVLRDSGYLEFVGKGQYRVNRMT